LNRESGLLNKNKIGLMTRALFILLMSFCVWKSHAQSCISKGDAEKILGQPAHLVMHQVETKDSIVQYRCTYTIDSKENPAGKESNLYYLLEEYQNKGAAGKSFKHLISANEGMPGFYLLSGCGDEAVIRTDSANFQLIMVRKSDRIIRMKVNKVTRTSSLNELKSVTKKIVEQM
jgi:hypothetical protein